MINTILFYRTVPLNVFNCGISFTPAGRTPACEISPRTAAVFVNTKLVFIKDDKQLKTGIRLTANQKYVKPRCRR